MLGERVFHDPPPPHPALVLPRQPPRFPVAALRTTLVEAVSAGLAEDVDRAGKVKKVGVSLGDVRTDVVKLLDWYILREPDRTPVLFGEICLNARLRLGLEPRDVGDLL
ncbi:hypothetical protein AB0N17_31975 [Streptomyces sp. NPDC051133]|uniref:hypothetical protein n=1 Tax=Streptomyces sp. NPDC051133 TaxID=3155521 RepID=UPI0034327C67